MTKEPIECLNQIKKDLSSKIIFSIFIGTMLSVLASSLVSYFDQYSLEIILILIFCLFISGTVFFIKNNRKILSSKLFICGFFAYKPKTNECIKIHRYTYSEDIVNNLRYLFSESPNEVNMWEKEKLNFFDFDGKKIKKIKNNFGHNLLKENTEYCILSELSTTLTDFFNDDGLTKNTIQKYTRDEIPEFLAKNRFLNTFSRSMNERAAFSDKDTKNGIGRIVCAFGKNGEKYDSFDLVLPKESKIKKKDDGFIIETPKLTLEVEIKIDGTNYCAPNKFEHLYLKDSPLNIKLYKVEIYIDVKFNFWSSLFCHIENSHKWVDIFLNKLQNKYDAKKFFELINWEHNLLIYEVLSNQSTYKKLQNK